MSSELEDDGFVEVPKGSSSASSAPQPQVDRYRYSPAQVNDIIFQSLFTDNNLTATHFVAREIIAPSLEKKNKANTNINNISPLFYIFQKNNTESKQVTGKGKDKNKEETSDTESELSADTKKNNVAVFYSTIDQQQANNNGESLLTALRAYQLTVKNNPQLACRFLAVPIATHQPFDFPFIKKRRAHFLTLIIDTENNIAYLNDSSPKTIGRWYKTDYIQKALRKTFGHELQFKMHYSGAQSLNNTKDCGVYCAESIIGIITKENNYLFTGDIANARAAHQQKISDVEKNCQFYRRQGGQTVLPTDMGHMEIQETILNSSSTAVVAKNNTDALAILANQLLTALEAYKNEAGENANASRLQTVKKLKQLTEDVLADYAKPGNETVDSINLAKALMGGVLYFKNQVEQKHESQWKVGFWKIKHKSRSRLAEKLAPIVASFENDTQGMLTAYHQYSKRKIMEKHHVDAVTAKKVHGINSAF